MTKKHFNKLALELAAARPYRATAPHNWSGWRVAVRAVAQASEESNPRFDREKFLTACLTWGTQIKDGELVRWPEGDQPDWRDG
jgi:hypothetical protein